VPRRVRVLKKKGGYQLTEKDKKMMEDIRKKDIDVGKLLKVIAQGDERFARKGPLTKKEQETIATMEKHFKNMMEHPERYKKLMKKVK
jgi:hypothetical protein